MAPSRHPRWYYADHLAKLFEDYFQNIVRRGIVKGTDEDWENSWSNFLVQLDRYQNRVERDFPKQRWTAQYWVEFLMYDEIFCKSAN